MCPLPDNFGALSPLEQIKAMEDYKQELVRMEEEKARILKEAEEKKRLEELQNSIVIINVFKLDNTRIVLKVSDPNNRLDVHRLLENTSSHYYNFYDYSHTFEIGYWKELESNLLKLNNVKIEYSKNIAKQIDDYLSKPHYFIRKTPKSIVVELHPLINYNHKLASIPGNKFDWNTKMYNIPLTEAWRVYEYVPPDGNIKVKYEESALTFIEEQASKKVELTEIMKADIYEPYKDIDFNGYTLKPYQTTAVRFIELSNYRTIDADEMGLGKSPTAIAAVELARRRNPDDNNRALVICPARLRENWEKQIFKFTGEYPAQFKGLMPSDDDILRLLVNKKQWNIISYESVGKVIDHKKDDKTEGGNTLIFESQERNLWAEVIRHSRFKYIIPDEAHYIRNTDSGRSKGVRQLVTVPCVIELTGTPVMNKPEELWPLLFMVDPETFPSQERFVNQYTVDGKKVRNVKELKEVMSMFMFRRTKKDVMKFLKPIERQVEYYKLSDDGQQRYNAALEGVYKKIDEAGNNYEKEITHILAQLNYCRQICAQDKVESGYVKELMENIIESHNGSDDKYNKILFASFFQEPAFNIYNQFTNVSVKDRKLQESLGINLGSAKNILSFVQPAGLEGIKVIDVPKRMELIEQFNSDKNINYLIGTLMTLQEGLDITGAGYVIHNDLWWNPSVHHQYEGRAYGRASDPHSITSIYIVASNTIDEMIFDLHFNKNMMFNELVEGESEMAAQTVSVAKRIIEQLKNRRR
jgi:SNF2 family DNA or RNA helicase